MIIIPIKWLFHWEYTLFSDKPNSSEQCSIAWLVDDFGESRILEWNRMDKLMISSWITMNSQYSHFSTQYFHWDFIGFSVRTEVFLWLNDVIKPGESGIFSPPKVSDSPTWLHVRWGHIY